MDDFEKELKLGFLDEAEQSIADAELAFLALETEPENNEHINKIFRLAHNLKGSSKAVGFEQLGQFTHEFESFVLRVKNNELKVSATIISVMLKVTDFIKTMLADLKVNLDAAFSTEPLLTEMKFFLEIPAQALVEPELEPVLMTEPVEATVISFPEKLKHTEERISVMAGPQVLAKPQVLDENIRVSLSKIDKLLNLVGEMVILQSVLSQNSANNNFVNFKKTTEQLGKVTKDIQETSMGLRMVPVKTTFHKMQRIVRDTAQLLDKDVVLMLFGEETELDKGILENINDPLVHLIRNSVDHGIESAATRLAAGKKPQGSIQLKAFHRSGRLVIEVIDDGAGLDTENLKKIAITKKIIKNTDFLTEAESYKLIFAPGFSTKELVTEVSGRGVGMDVVKTNIEKLGGEIEIESIKLKGTTIRITLPLTMAIIDGLIATYNNEKYIIPLSHVHETLRPQAAQIYEEKNLGSVLLLRGENVPMHYLGDFFNEKSHKKETEMIAFVFRNNNKPFAILVDDILGLQQVVVKRPSLGLQSMKGVSGTTILGDGKPSLILEPNDLLLRKITRVEKVLNKNISPINKESVA